MKQVGKWTRRPGARRRAGSRTRSWRSSWASRAWPAVPSRRSRPREPLTGRVVRVIDGDTIAVRIDKKVLTVRYIGINTRDSRMPADSMIAGPDRGGGIQPRAGAGADGAARAGRPGTGHAGAHARLCLRGRPHGQRRDGGQRLRLGRDHAAQRHARGDAPAAPAPGAPAQGGALARLALSLARAHAAPRGAAQPVGLRRRRGVPSRADAAHLRHRGPAGRGAARRLDVPDLASRQGRARGRLERPRLPSCPAARGTPRPSPNAATPTPRRRARTAGDRAQR